MEKCPICHPVDVEWKRIARARAIKTSHILAIKKAEEGIEGLEWEEVYAVYFPKIFKHEHQRNLRYEEEVALDKLVRKYHVTPDPNICCYHQENLAWFGGDSYNKTMKKVRQKYATSKWPNSNSAWS